MTLHLAHLICTICRRDIGEVRDQHDLDGVDEEGRSTRTSFFHDMMITIPRARYRDHIAPDMCDECWLNFASWTMKRHKNKPPPPFNRARLMEWIVVQLQNEAKRLMPKRGKIGITGRDRYLRSLDGPVSVGRP